MVAANLNTGGFTPISRTSHDNSDLHIKAQCKQRGHQIQVFAKNVSLPLRSFVGSHFSKKSSQTLPTQFTGTLREDLETRVPRQVGRRQPSPLAGGAVLKGISFELGTTVPRAPLVSPQAPVSSLAAPRHHLRPRLHTLQSTDTWPYLRFLVLRHHPDYRDLERAAELDRAAGCPGLCRRRSLRCRHGCAAE